jgi:CubicO group peptidase (beta-lactamase class C family)
MAYGDFLRTRLWEPLGMTDTGFPASMTELIPNLASGYEVIGETDFTRAAYQDRSWAIGSGSVYSTPRDLFRWMQGVRGNRVLTPAATRRMFDTDYGCGWITTERHNRQAIHLTGWDNLGFSADVLHFPVDSLTVVVLGNLDIISVTNEISDGVSAIMLGEAYTLLALSDEPIDATLASKVVGTYQWGDDFFVPGATIQIVVEDGRLFAKQGDQLVGILRVSEQEFIHRMSWARMTFPMDADGEIREMLYYGRFKAVKQTAE